MPISRTIIYTVIGVVVVAIIVGILFITMQRPSQQPTQPTQKQLLGTIIYTVATCLTGPFAGPAREGSWAIEDFWKTKNYTIEVSNGYYKVELVIEDNQYRPDTTTTIVTRWLQQYGDKAPLVVTCGTHVVAAVYPLMAENKKLYTDPSMAERFANATAYPWYYLPPSATYSDQYRAFLKWFKDNWNETRPPRLAIVWETRAFGPLVKPDVEAFARQLGYNITTEVVEIGSTDATPQLTRIRDFGADAVAVILPPSETALVLRQSLEVGLYPRAFALFYYSIFYEPLVKAYAPIIKALSARGSKVYAESSIVPLGYNVPGMRDIIDAWRTYRPNANLTSIYVYTWVHTMINYEILRRAAEMGNPYDPNNLRKALESIRNFDTGGLTPPITYTSTDHRGTDIVWIWLVDPDRTPPFVKVAEVNLSGVRARFGG